MICSIKRRSISVGVVMLCLFCLLIGCSKTTDQNDKKDDKTMRLTKEYALEHSSLEESDLENVDFESFVDFYELTTADLDNYDLKALLDMYKEQQEIGPKTDYTEIYRNAEGTLAETDLDHISQMIWDLHEGSRNRFMALDFENRAVYYGEGNYLSACGQEYQIGELSDEDIAFIRQTLIDSGITGWQNSYVGTSEGTTGHFAWTIGFRMEDGHCVSYSGSGVKESGTPEEMTALLNKLVDHFSAQ